MDPEDKIPELENLMDTNGAASKNDGVVNDDVIVETFDAHRSLVPKLRIFLAANLLLILTCAGIVLGFVLGLAVRELQPSKDALMWIGWSSASCLSSVCLSVCRPIFLRVYVLSLSLCLSVARSFCVSSLCPVSVSLTVCRSIFLRVYILSLSLCRSIFLRV